MSAFDNTSTYDKINGTVLSDVVAIAHGIRGQQDELRFAGGPLQDDHNGDAQADFAIKLTGVTTLTATDLLL
jgi:hypothetical protein